MSDEELKAARAHMIELSEEMFVYAHSVQEIMKLSKKERFEIADRIKQIRKEMNEFKRKYPNG